MSRVTRDIDLSCDWHSSELENFHTRAIEKVFLALSDRTAWHAERATDLCNRILSRRLVDKNRQSSPRIFSFKYILTRKHLECSTREFHLSNPPALTNPLNTPTPHFVSIFKSENLLMGFVWNRKLTNSLAKSLSQTISNPELVHS